MCARLCKSDLDAPHEPETQNLLQAQVRHNLNTLLAGAQRHLAHVRFEDFLLPKEVTDDAQAAIRDWIPEATGEPPQEEDTTDRKWVPYHEKEWADVNEAAKVAAFEKIRDNPWCADFCDRKRDLLLLLYAKQAMQLEEPKVEVVWDLSQNPSRIPTGEDGIPCAMPRAVPWLSVSRRRLLGVESLSLQGADMASLVTVRAGVWPNNLCRDLAGNALCASQCVAWMLANVMSAHGR